MFKNLFLGNNFAMKKSLETIESVRTKLEKIKGQNITMQVNRGRRKIVNFDARLEKIYPSVFTVTVPCSSEPERSYSYTEVLCGNVKICPKNL